MTILYRTVSEGERAAPAGGKGYEAAVGGVEGKYFYPTAQQAEKLARANFPSQGVQTLTSVQVPKSMLDAATRLHVAGEGQVIFMTSEQLSGIDAPQVWNFFPRRRAMTMAYLPHSDRAIGKKRGCPRLLERTRGSPLGRRCRR